MGTVSESTVMLGGVRLSATTLFRAADAIVDRACGGGGGGVHLVNAYTLALADGDGDYRNCLNSAWLNLPDGRPLEWLSGARGDQPSLVQTRGRDVVDNVFELGLQVGLRHYLLGSTERVLDDMRRALERRYPGVAIVGVESPPFRALTDAEQSEQIARIRESEAQVVWVGLGTPKQDFEVERLAGQIDAVSVAVGAAFDFIAGSRSEAPKWMSRIGFEWLHRLLSEPRRLWRRYLFGNLRFMKIAIATMVASRNSRK